MAASLTYSGLPPELKKLASKSLGAGVLKSLFVYRYTYHIMVKAVDDDFVSLALYHYEEEKREGVRRTVGVIDCVCVDPNLRGQGYGTLMTFAVLRKMSVSGATEVESLVKLPEKDDGPKNRKPYSRKVNEFMRSMGFELRGYYDNHYMKSSLKYRYSCAICEALPDKCRAADYVIDSEGNEIEGDDA